MPALQGVAKGNTVWVNMHAGTMGAGLQDTCGHFWVCALMWARTRLPSAQRPKSRVPDVNRREL